MYQPDKTYETKTSLNEGKHVPWSLAENYLVFNIHNELCRDQKRQNVSLMKSHFTSKVLTLSQTRAFSPCSNLKTINTLHLSLCN